MEQIQNEKKILNHLVGDLSQAVVEGSAILPAGMPEMARILMVTPYAEVASAEPDQGRVAVEGNLTLLICYLCADGLTHSFESTSVFRSTVEVEGAPVSYTHLDVYKRQGFTRKGQCWVLAQDNDTGRPLRI